MVSVPAVRLTELFIESTKNTHITPRHIQNIIARRLTCSEIPSTECRLQYQVTIVAATANAVCVLLLPLFFFLRCLSVSSVPDNQKP